MKISILLLFCTYSPFLYSQVFLDPDTLLNKIDHLQSRGDHFYQDGLFPSQRYRGKRKNAKQDNTIFFTSLIALTLQSSRPYFSSQSQSILDTIMARATRNYFRYKNRNDDITYNFWQTNPDLFFPNDRRRSKKERFRMPDDFDDTSIIFLTKAKNDSLNRLLKRRMILHTNLYSEKVHSTFGKYRKYKAYNTWVGKKMALDFDICVMANTLLFVFNSGLELNEYDSETIALIEEIVLNNDHLRHPVIVSPYYQNSAIILYHLARLLSASGSNQFEKIRPQIINDLKDILPRAGNRMEQILILSSLYRLGVPVEFRMDDSHIENDFDKFVFFAATPFAGRRLWIRRLVGRSGFLNFNHQCEAYYWTLILENVVLKNKIMGEGKGGG